QETMVRAWRGLGGFEERASLRTWLTRIATRVCLDALADRRRRLRPIELEGPGTVDDPLTELPRGRWIERIPDELALPADADPLERVSLRQSIRLAFVTALQRLPPKQRAALLLADVLEWPAAEVADTLETSVASVNSALQRARAKLAGSGDLPEGAASLTAAQSALLDRYVETFERYDIDALVHLLHEDATLSMPPYRLWLRGHETISRWMLARGTGHRPKPRRRYPVSTPPSRKMFVNLPVRDLKRSVDFFTKLGFRFEPKFTDENATCMIVGEGAFVMLLVERFFKTFTKRQLC